MTLFLNSHLRLGNAIQMVLVIFTTQNILMKLFAAVKVIKTMNCILYPGDEGVYYYHTRSTREEYHIMGRN